MKFKAEYYKEREKQTIKMYLFGHTIEKISQELNLCDTTIITYLNKHNIKRKRKTKYTYDESFFEKIDTEEKAYFLGLMYADGCVHKNHCTADITLQIQDKYILEKFKNAIKSTSPVRTYNVTQVINHCEKITHSTFAKFRIFNQKIKKDLINLGCFPRKSLTLEFPTEKQVPEFLTNHFMRGFLDGDGTIKLHKNKIKGFGIVAPKQFCLKYQEILCKNCKLYKTKLYQCPQTPEMYEMTYGGNIQINRIFKFLYGNATLFLERKHQRFLQNQKSIKTFTLLSPTNETVQINDLGEFCELHKLDYSALYKTFHKTRNHHKNWRLLKIPNIGHLDKRERNLPLLNP